MSAEPSVPQISYAQPRPPAQRLLRRYWVPVTLLLVLTSAYWWAPPLWHRLRVSYWYERAAEHRTPDGTVLCDMQFTPLQGHQRTSSEPYVPRPWQQFYAIFSPPGFRSEGTAFLGGRRTPAGQQVLVAVDMVPDLHREPSQPLHVRAFVPGTGWELPKQTLDARVTVQLPHYKQLRLFAGSSDPADPSHFTIPFDADGRPGAIDGWVRDDRVDLELRPAPVTQPLPASPG